MISVKVNAPCGTIVLDNPSQCNALNCSMIADLQLAIDDLMQEKKVRGIVIMGAGHHFCSGLDLAELHETHGKENATEHWFAVSQSMQSLIEKLLLCPKPIIAAVDGAAVASGFSLALACDLIVASQRATFSIPAPRLGLVSGTAVPLLCFRAGASIASQILLGGEEISATEAKRLGLVQHVVDTDQVWVRASTWVDSIAEGAAEAIQLTKRVLNEMVGEQLSTHLASGAAAMATALTTEAATEGLAAFAERRDPKFP